MKQPPNPYQPPVAVADDQVEALPGEVRFRTDRQGDRQHAEDYFLVYLQPQRLMSASFGLVVMSLAILIFAVQFRAWAFWPALVVALVTSGIIYQMLVRRARLAAREGQERFGLNSPDQFVLRCSDDEIELKTALGSYRWPKNAIKTYRTRRGLLLCPEPHLYIFVPRNSDFGSGNFRTFTRQFVARSVPS